MKREYVNNQDLKVALREWRTACQLAGKELPIPEYIGECIVLMAEKLASKYTFYQYTYRDELIGDGILACVNYLHNFDPDPEKNYSAFAYITQILMNSFVRRINVEQKHAYTRAKMIQENMFAITRQEGDVDHLVEPVDNSIDSPHQTVIEKYEAKLKAKKEKLTESRREKGIKVRKKIAA